MQLLAINTAGPSVEVALGSGGYFRDTDFRNSSAAVLPAVDALLREARTSLSALDGIACVVGPGSFTGIRIGVSTARALAYALDKPVLGMHYLRVLAYTDSADGYDEIMSVADGGNSTAYLATYTADRREKAACVCVSQAEAVARASAFDGAVCCDERMAALLPDAIAPAADGRALCRAATELFGQAGDWSLLQPVYVRESQAEKDLREKTERG